ncbi:putative pectinesterase/pectinesterase inhibitor 54 [Vitis vinifera]|uniref:Putative pectinesterase/pectinesterase inhibitor 54 n=1 Tax=Vitis vinifera TaxID=29760 RepID=A0A438GXT8_VITVI|nr:putative pectinesterase/pectinesterase inhibitor 54 [Vitis vinifera]
MSMLALPRGQGLRARLNQEGGNANIEEEKVSGGCRICKGVCFSAKLFFLSCASMSWAAMDDAYEKRVQSECGFTTYTKLCVQTLLGLGHSKVDIPFVLVNKILSETRLPTSNIAKFSYQLATPEAHSAHLVRDSCDMLMSMSLKQLNQSLLALKESARKNKHDIQTWLSAALTFSRLVKTWPWR